MEYYGYNQYTVAKNDKDYEKKTEEGWKLMPMYGRDINDNEGYFKVLTKKGNIVQDIFSILNVQPEEEFYWFDYTPPKYKIGEDLVLYRQSEYGEWEVSPLLSLRGLLYKPLLIRKIIKWNDIEIKMAEYYYALGFKYVAKDVNDKVYVYKEEPIYKAGYWIFEENENDQRSLSEVIYEMPHLQRMDKPILLTDILKEKC